MHNPQEYTLPDNSVISAIELLPDTCEMLLTTANLEYWEWLCCQLEGQMMDTTEGRKATKYVMSPPDALDPPEELTLYLKTENIADFQFVLDYLQRDDMTDRREKSSSHTSSTMSNSLKGQLF